MLKSSSRNTVVTRRTHLKDTASCLTHLLGAICSLAILGPSMSKSLTHPGGIYPASAAIFILSMFLLYSASAAYHGIYAGVTATRVLQKLDHIMIYLLIAGSYTPICLLVLPPQTGFPLFYLVWIFAFFGLVLSVCWISSPKWLNSAIYICMGWLCLLAFRQIIQNMSTPAFLWLLAGGIIYTVGGVIYALKLPVFNTLHKGFGSHEIFHLFVLAGSLCHFVMFYFYLL